MGAKQIRGYIAGIWSGIGFISILLFPVYSRIYNLIPLYGVVFLVAIILSIKCEGRYWWAGIVSSLIAPIAAIISLILGLMAWSASCSGKELQAGIFNFLALIILPLTIMIWVLIYLKISKKERLQNEHQEVKR
ncbi:MAG: hypothetical protein AABX17_03220 [Nanoarchaeota archaeon]